MPREIGRRRPSHRGQVTSHRGVKEIEKGDIMKNLVMVLGLITVVALSSHPVFAMGHGMGGHGGGGSGMMGDWGETLRNWWQEWQNRGAYENPPNHQRKQGEEWEQKYRRETAELRKAIEMKSRELDSILDSPNPDVERARTVHNEIKGLRAKLEERRIEHDREMREFDRTAPYGGEHNRRSYDTPRGQYSRGMYRGGGMGGHGAGQ